MVSVIPYRFFKLGVNRCRTIEGGGWWHCPFIKYKELSECCKVACFCICMHVSCFCQTSVFMCVCMYMCVHVLQYIHASVWRCAHCQHYSIWWYMCLKDCTFIDLCTWVLCQHLCTHSPVPLHLWCTSLPFYTELTRCVSGMSGKALCPPTCPGSTMVGSQPPPWWMR